MKRHRVLSAFALQMQAIARRASRIFCAGKGAKKGESGSNEAKAKCDQPKYKKNSQK